MNFFLDPIRLLAGHRRMLLATTWNDVRSRFAGSSFGLIWLFLYPLMFLGTYAAVYIYIFQVKFPQLGTNGYVALIFCGLIPFIGFAEALGNGITSISSNASMIKNTLYPVELFPVKAVLSSQCTQIVGTGLLLVVLGFMQKLSWYSFLIIPIWCCQVAFSFGLLWILSGLNVYFRDIQNAMSITILLMMMLSPIAYTREKIPNQLLPFLKLNPLYYFINAYRDCLMFGRAPQTSEIIVVLLLGLIPLTLGYWFFSRLKLLFAEHV